MKLFYSGALVLAAALTACHRDAAGPAYDLTGTYTAATVFTPATPAQLFTAQGAVTDAAVIKRYLARRQGTATDYFSTTEVPTNYNYTLQLVFRGGNRVSFVVKYPTRTDTIRAEVTDQQAASFRIQGLDSVTVQTNPVASTDVIGQLAKAIYLVQAARKCKPFYIGAPGYPGGSGTSEQCRVRPVNIVGAHGSQLYLPYLSWMLWSKGAILGYRNQNNLFNPAALTYLTAGDTLVVQEREIALHR